jgi:hypothetical protein
MAREAVFRGSSAGFTPSSTDLRIRQIRSRGIGYARILDLLVCAATTTPGSRSTIALGCLAAARTLMAILKPLFDGP